MRSIPQASGRKPAELLAAHLVHPGLCSLKVTESTTARAGSPPAVTLAPPIGWAQVWPLSVETRNDKNLSTWSHPEDGTCNTIILRDMPARQINSQAREAKARATRVGNLRLDRLLTHQGRGTTAQGAGPCALAGPNLLCQPTAWARPLLPAA